MVSIACCYSVAARLPDLHPLLQPKPFTFPRRAPFPRRHATPLRPFDAINADPSSLGGRPRQQQERRLRTLFPGGFKRPEIKVPTLVLQLSVEEVLKGEDSTAAQIDVALSRGVSIVVLDCVGDSGAKIYEAARALKALVGERAYFLVAERVDIAAAVGASGVVLSDDAIPALIARNMMMKAETDSVYLPLVARTVQNLNSAVSSSVSEGADFLIINGDMNNYTGVLESFVTQTIKVPIFFNIINLAGDAIPSNMVSSLLKSGACGLVLSINDMKLFTDDVLNDFVPLAHEANGVLKDEYPKLRRMKMNDASAITSQKKGITGFMKLDEREIQLIETERQLINEVVAVLQKAAPMVIFYC